MWILIVSLHLDTLDFKARTNLNTFLSHWPHCSPLSWGLPWESLELNVCVTILSSFPGMLVRNGQDRKNVVSFYHVVSLEIHWPLLQIFLFILPLLVYTEAKASPFMSLALWLWQMWYVACTAGFGQHMHCKENTFAYTSLFPAFLITNQFFLFHPLLETSLFQLAVNTSSLLYQNKISW